MKNTLLILISTICLCSCSRKQVAAVDFVKAGKDISWSSGDGFTYVLHVDKRSGTSLEGVRIVSTRKDGKVSTFTADYGTIVTTHTQDTVGGVLYTNFAKIVLENAHAKSADGAVKEYKEATFFMHP